MYMVSGILYIQPIVRSLLMMMNILDFMQYICHVNGQPFCFKTYNVFHILDRILQCYCRATLKIIIIVILVFNPFEPTRFPPKFAPGTAIFQGFNLFVPWHEEFLISAW